MYINVQFIKLDIHNSNIFFNVFIYIIFLFIRELYFDKKNLFQFRLKKLIKIYKIWKYWKKIINVLYAHLKCKKIWKLKRMLYIMYWINYIKSLFFSICFFICVIFQSNELEVLIYLRNSPSFNISTIVGHDNSNASRTAKN